jgi:hypothetical protein
VDVAPVPKDNHQYDESPVMNLINDSVIAGAYAPLTPAADEFLRASRPRIMTQELNSRLNPPPRNRVKLAQLAHGRRREGDSAGHARPRSAPPGVDRRWSTEQWDGTIGK